MSFPRYPAYKDSGVEWLGTVPSHWDVTRLKFVASVQTGVAKGKDNAEKDTITVPYLRVANVQDGYFDLTEVAHIEIPAEDLQRYALQAGDVLMNEGGDFDKLGRGHVWDGSIDPCIHQNHVFAVRPHCVSSTWLNRITGSAYAQFYFMSRSKQSTNLASISSTNLMELPVVTPPTAEQRLIEAFLDRETAKIDALVAEQEQLITLLKEKRQTVISHAVTKGLDPSVPMKDSGVEWLGEVPAHWSVQPLSTVTQVIQTGPFGSQLHSDEYVVDSTPVINPSNIIDGQLCPEPSATVSDDVLERLFHHKLIAGEIVVGRRGEMGRCAVVMPSQEGWLCGTGCLKIQLTSKAVPEFFWRYLSTEMIKQYLSLQSVGSTMENLNTQILARVPIPLPSPQEQAEICEAVSVRLKALASLESEVVFGVRLLQERRSALISAAVTGQIDVRGLVADKEAA